MINLNQTSEQAQRPSTLRADLQIVTIFATDGSLPSPSVKGVMQDNPLKVTVKNSDNAYSVLLAIDAEIEKEARTSAVLVEGMSELIPPILKAIGCDVWIIKDKQQSLVAPPNLTQKAAEKIRDVSRAQHAPVETNSVDGVVSRFKQLKDSIEAKATQKSASNAEFARMIGGGTSSNQDPSKNKANARNATLDDDTMSEDSEINDTNGE